MPRLIVLLMACLIVGAPSMSFAQSATFVVDDDLVQCPDADFTTATGIQQAIVAAPPGSTIRVCPGTYLPINISKTLVLQAPRQHGQATQCPPDVIADPTKDAIIDAGNTAIIGVTVAADDVVFYGFTVQNTTGNPGIYTFPAFSGYEIVFNVVQQNTFGLYLNSSGAQQTWVSHNCFRFNNRPGSASGDGIYSDQGLRNAQIKENFFTGHNVASMVFAGNQQNLTIEHNDSIDDATLIAIFNTANAVVAHNHFRNGRGSGVFVGGGVTGHISLNLLEQSSTGSGISVNGPNEVVIEKNHVREFGFDGIRLDNTSLSTVAGNKVERNLRDGIRLRNNSNNNMVRDNLSRDNARDGMRVDGPASTPPSAQSNANTIEQNKMLGNQEHDCHDDTAGGATALTANFWIKDIGKTENRAGLCKNASVTP